METRICQRIITSGRTLNETIEVIRDEWTPTIGGQPSCIWDFCLIPAGSFMMGGNSYSYRQYKVTLTSDFYLGRHPVTQWQWEMVMGSNPSRFKGADRPVDTVSWEDVQQYMQKLNELAGETRYRLPTEAEWEYACRAGSNGEYCFGDDASMLDEYAWYNNNSSNQTHPVCLKRPNSWGLYDMHGNVWEWVQDWYDDYPRGSVTDPQGPSSGKILIRIDPDDPARVSSGPRHVYRGGSWHQFAPCCRSSFRRYHLLPDERTIALGFRILRTRNDPTCPLTDRQK
jgi:formylglycine-generating enzyme required for sulfatase activity